MRLAMAHEIHSLAWTATQGGHVTHAAMEYLLGQAEQGICCPITMTYAAVPALRCQPDVAAEWEPRLLAPEYDPRFVPAETKTSATFGMAMTEKQGGSDVRANLTRATPLGRPGPSEAYRLRGHKWFCSAPMSDAFLTLAQTNKGLGCFLVPRWRADGTRNSFFIQRLKDKLGNRANASSEIEYHDTWARLVGEEGRGVATIIKMVHHTRLDAAMAPAALMRQALVQATHHAAHRHAFGKLLIDQPLMRNVLADLAIEWEAGLTLVMRVARGFDDGISDSRAAGFARIAVAVAKYWLNKRAPTHVAEALECLGGAGYVEESIMPRLYREAPLSGIWEGSSNVICLDVLRAIHREPDSLAAYLEELDSAKGGDRRLDVAIEALKSAFNDLTDSELRARHVTQMMALTLQGALLVRHAPSHVADAFCGSRLHRNWGHTFGTLPKGTDFLRLIDRARPKLS